MSAVDVIVAEDASAAARIVAERLAEQARAGGNIVLTGGSTPRHAYEIAAELESTGLPYECRLPPAANELRRVLANDFQRAIQGFCQPGRQILRPSPPELDPTRRPSTWFSARPRRRQKKKRCGPCQQSARLPEYRETSPTHPGSTG